MDGPLFGADVERSAIISECGLYRYTLGRQWAAGPPLNFLMLNPSVADATDDDPTIRKCLGFARRWGFPGIVVTNLFAFRATAPADMRRASDPVGPENDDRIVAEAKRAGLVVAAWGTDGGFRGRDRVVKRLLIGAGVTIHAARFTKDGHPWHPLMLPYRFRPEPWVGPGYAPPVTGAAKEGGE
jgi:hypothetical protein